MPSFSWRPQCIVLPSEPSSFVRDVKGYVTCKVFYMPEAKQHFVRWKTQGQSLPDISGAGGEVKL